MTKLRFRENVLVYFRKGRTLTLPTPIPYLINDQVNHWPPLANQITKCLLTWPNFKVSLFITQSWTGLTLTVKQTLEFRTILLRDISWKLPTRKDISYSIVPLNQLLIPLLHSCLCLAWFPPHHKRKAVWFWFVCRPHGLGFFPIAIALLFYSSNTFLCCNGLFENCFF